MKPLLLLHPELNPEMASRLRECSPLDLWRGSQSSLRGGRGGIKRISLGGRDFLLKAERRGGLSGGLLPDAYLRQGPFLREWGLSLILAKEGLTPPMHARWFVPAGAGFRVLTLLEPVSRAASVAEIWRGGGLNGELLLEVGRFVGALHLKGVLHADLNLGNLLVPAGGKIAGIDWRHSRIRPSLSSQQRRRNLLRLARSFHKVRHRFGLPWPEGIWEAITGGYARGFGAAEPWLGTFSASASQPFWLRRLLWASAGR